MLLIDKIANEKLTKVERDIANYLLEHRVSLSNLSTRDIAKEVYCSSSAVIRLAHKLGYQGYNQLKEQLIKEQKYLDSHFDNIDANLPFSKDDNMMGVVGSIKEVINEATKDTVSLIHHDSLQRAIRIIDKAQHIYVFGFGAYVPLATVFQQKMSRIKKHVIVQNHVGEEKYQADMLDVNDCAIIVSYSGENHSLIRVASLLKEKNIPIIIMTSFGENTLSCFSECILYIATREKLFSKIANFTSEHSVSLLFNILYSCYFRLNYENNLDYKIKHSKKVEVEHFSSNQIIMEEDKN